MNSGPPGWPVGQDAAARPQGPRPPLQSPPLLPLPRTITPSPACLCSATHSPSPQSRRTSTKTMCSSCISSPTCTTSGLKANTHSKGNDPHPFSHPSTNQARPRLASEIRRDRAVHPLPSPKRAQWTRLFWGQLLTAHCGPGHLLTSKMSLTFGGAG